MTTAQTQSRESFRETYRRHGYFFKEAAMLTIGLGVIIHLARELIQMRNEDPDTVADAAIAFCLDGLRG